jgi:heme/copper-type cytochrome/quinol oxidase subunit 4
MHALESAVYLLCVVTSLVAMWLLMRSYRENRSRLLLWSAAAFVAFALNNLLLFTDVVLLPDFDLRSLRTLTALIGVVTLLYAFIWEID